MANANSTRAAAKPKARRKPVKPYDGYPLTPHSIRSDGVERWTKKIAGIHRYFIGDWKAALAEYEQYRDAFHQGVDPRTELDGPAALTLADACNRFLTAKKQSLESGDIVQATFDGYFETCKRLVDFFGRHRPLVELKPADFGRLRASWSKKWGPTTIAGEIRRIRVLLRWVYESELLDRPLRVGPDFKPPARRVVRLHQQARGEKFLEVEQIHALLGIASPDLRAMILLGVNAGLGNRDVAKIEFRHVDLDTGWLSYPRDKTGLNRRALLWSETIAALRASMDNRKSPKNSAHRQLIFVTKYGGPWFAEDNGACPISAEFKKLVRQLDIELRGSFYALRHVFRTVADETRDQPAIDLVMGHARHDMASVYRERISDEQLQRIASHVHAWLFGGRDDG